MGTIWKKGALHTHTLWSDGRSLPEVAILSYREAGYDFVCLSDHNIFQSDENMWLQVMGAEGGWPPHLSVEELERSRALLPGKIVEKKRSFKTFVRLKTFDELQKEFEVPGEFLLVPGEEITVGNQSFNEENRQYQLHVNFFNSRVDFPVPSGGTGADLLRKILENYRVRGVKNAFCMLNHPFWRVWDIDPRLLIDFSEIRLFEICNSGTENMPDNWICTREKYWDFILAHRLMNGDGLLYGTACDDAHFYDEPRRHTPGACCTGWVMVECRDEFTPEKLTEAILNGRFYSSCGVELESYNFDGASRTLDVMVKSEPGVNYRIDFITTKKDFDSSVKIKDFPFEPEIHSRKFPVIGEDIGRVVKSVDGISGSYTMQDDDLYVRAVITSDQPGIIKNSFYPEFRSAWVQPVKNPVLF
ncbi:MAG: hypothetical protein IKA87_09075 [Lentisphaeria bacterium]|nr:hypothetical protein [Lentisphaeria bacterium]